MEAKDTVMDEDEKFGCSLIGKYPFKDVRDVIDETCKAQAEISFKAGIREVVEFIKEHSSPEASYTDDLHMTRSWLELPSSLWKAQRKEWGISPE